MVQAARGGVQNIAEASMASATSKKPELKLPNVARASLDELLLDYQDFLRQRGFPLWPKDSPEAQAVRASYLLASSDRSDRSDSSDSPSDPYGIALASPETAANTLICLINQASYLLGRQLQKLEQEFLEHGGFTERLHTARVRSRATPPDRPPAPACPRCGKSMVQRTARQGAHTGQQFWGCSAYPDCKGTRPVA